MPNFEKWLQSGARSPLKAESQTLSEFESCNAKRKEWIVSKSSIVSFRITHDNKERLCKIQSKSGLDKSKILNFLIESFEPHKHLDLLPNPAAMK